MKTFNMFIFHILKQNIEEQKLVSAGCILCSNFHYNNSQAGRGQVGYGV